MRAIFSSFNQKVEISKSETMAKGPNVPEIGNPNLKIRACNLEILEFPYHGQD